MHAMECDLVVRRNDVCYDIKEPRIHHVKQKKPDAKGHTCCAVPFTWRIQDKRINPQRQRADSRLPGAGVKEE